MSTCTKLFSGLAIILGIAAFIMVREPMDIEDKVAPASRFDGPTPRLSTVDKADTAVYPPIKLEQAEALQDSSIPQPAPVIDGARQLGLPELPLVIYQRYIEEAREGSPEAQYRISQIAWHCGVAVHNPLTDETEAMLRNAGGEWAVQVHQAVYTVCQELADHAGRATLVQEYQEFLDKAAAQDYPVAVLRKRIYGPNVPERSELIPYLIRALQENRVDRYMTAEVYFAVHMFVGRYYDTHRYLEDHAWGFVWCESKIRGCSRELASGGLKDFFHDHEVEAIFDRADEIVQAIEEEDWYTLAFDQ